MRVMVRMRLAAFVRSGRALAPAIAALVVLGVIHGGGASEAAPAYGYSAVMLFPVLAWAAKLVLDTEPDVQRRLARLTVGARREAVAGVLAATVIGAVFCAVALLAPWPTGSIRGPAPGTPGPSPAAGVALGVLAHLLALPAAVALGALAGRAVTRTVRNGITVLATGSVLAIVLGLSGSVASWLAPPVMATARALSQPAAPSASVLAQLAAWTAAWCLVALTGYAHLRRRRA